MIVIGTARREVLTPVMKSMAEECYRHLSALQVSVAKSTVSDGGIPLSVYEISEDFNKATVLGVASIAVRRYPGFAPRRGSNVLDNRHLEDIASMQLKKIATYDLGPYFADAGREHPGYKYFGPKGPPLCIAVAYQVMGCLPHFVWVDRRTYNGGMFNGVCPHVEPSDYIWHSSEGISDNEELCHVVWEDNFV